MDLHDPLFECFGKLQGIPTVLFGSFRWFLGDRFVFFVSTQCSCHKIQSDLHVFSKVFNHHRVLYAKYLLAKSLLMR